MTTATINRTLDPQAALLYAVARLAALLAAWGRLWAAYRALWASAKGVHTVYTLAMSAPEPPHAVKVANPCHYCGHAPSDHPAGRNCVLCDCGIYRAPAAIDAAPSAVTPEELAEVLRRIDARGFGQETTSDGKTAEECREIIEGRAPYMPGAEQCRAKEHHCDVPGCIDDGRALPVPPAPEHTKGHPKEQLYVRQGKRYVPAPAGRATGLLYRRTAGRHYVPVSPLQEQ